LKNGEPIAGICSSWTINVPPKGWVTLGKMVLVRLRFKFNANNIDPEKQEQPTDAK